jgi:hypothetical protein
MHAALSTKMCHQKQYFAAIRRMTQGTLPMCALGRSPQQEAEAKGVVAHQDEPVVPREVRAALDLRDYRRDAAHLRLLHHAAPETRPDDAGMVEGLAGREPPAGVEEGQTRRGPAAAR